MAGLLSGIAGALDLFNQGQAVKDTRALGSDAYSAAKLLGDQAIAGTKFRPFTTTSATGGSIGSDDQGGLNLTLSPEQEAMRSQLMSNAGSLFNKATGDRGAREQEVFNRLEALQQPGRERDRLALEERLFNQGREGVTTSMFGGTPEGLQLAKAIEESRGKSALDAMTFGQNEQIQQANIGNQFLASSNLAEDQLLKTLQGQTDIASLSDVARRQGQELATKAGMTGMQQQGLYNQQAAGLGQAQMSSIADLLANAGRNNSGGGLFGQLWGALGGDGAPQTPEQTAAQIANQNY